MLSLAHAVILLIAAILVVAALVVWVFASAFRKVGPNRALIVSGAGGVRVIRGGGAYVFPLLQMAQELSLETIAYDIVPDQALYTAQGIGVKVEAVSQVKVRSDREGILTAAEQLLSKAPADRETSIRHIIEGHMRSVIGQLELESLLKDPERVIKQMQEVCTSDLTKMGLELVSFNLKRISDGSGYIENLGRPHIAAIQKAAAIAQAAAERDVAIAKAEAQRQEAEAIATSTALKVAADAKAESARSAAARDVALSKAEADRDVAVRTADLQAAAADSKARQERAYDFAKQAQEAKFSQQQLAVQESKTALRQAELVAEVVRPAEAAREKQRVDAEGARQQRILAAQAEAEARLAAAKADAEAVRLRAEAEAEATRLRGQAEADAIRARAAALAEYPREALTRDLLQALPDLVREMAKPMEKIGKVTIVSQDGSAGMHRLTDEVTRLLVQAPALIEAATGVSLQELLRPAGPSAGTSQKGGTGADGIGRGGT